MLYRALRRGLNSKPVLVPQDEFIGDYVTSDTDWYESLYLYNESQLNVFGEKGTLSGIRDTVTNKLYFDLDSKDNIVKALDEAVVLHTRMIESGIKNIGIHFTGKKGVSLEAVFNREFTPAKFKSLTNELSKDLITVDHVVSDPNRIVRISNTRHQDTGLFKIPLTFNQLKECSADEILEMAKTPKPTSILETNTFEDTTLTLKPTPNTPQKDLGTAQDIDWHAKRASFLTNCRWGLQNGLFKDGERSNALLCLAATYKNQGFDLEHTYRLLKGVALLQARRTSTTRFDDDELYNNIICQVYSGNWNGGQFTCRDETSWLSGYCKSLGNNKCKHSSNTGVSPIDTTFIKFKDYAQNIDKNTIKSGIKELDSKIRMTIGKHLAILGAPSSGKSSLSIQLLENTSRAGIKSMFFSMDMSDLVTSQKLLQRESRKDENTLFEMYQRKNPLIDGYEKSVNEKYKNVAFCFRNGLDISSIRELIIEEQNKQNGELKLVVIDYAARIMGPFSDSNANGASIASGLRSIANELGVCVITLVQPPKSAGDAKDELTSMRQIKGSSVFEESLDILLGVFRPGFNPLNDSADDHFLVMSALKNRTGGLFTLNFTWDGLTGNIDSIQSDEDKERIKELIQQNKSSKVQKSDSWS